jgi:hypothetical protein
MRKATWEGGSNHDMNFSHWCYSAASLLLVCLRTAASKYKTLVRFFLAAHACVPRLVLNLVVDDQAMVRSCYESISKCISLWCMNYVAGFHESPSTRGVRRVFR